MPNILTIRNKIRASVIVGITYSFSVLASDAADPYLWLEEVEGVKALNWVQEQNKQSLKILKADARYPQLYQISRVRYNFLMTCLMSANGRN